jgi:hypothetical protein
MAEDLLSIIEEGFQDASIDLPERRYVNDGLNVAADCCEELVVQFSRIFAGQPGAEQVTGIRLPIASWTVEFFIWLFRSTVISDDDGTAPTMEALTDSAEILLKDAWMILNSLIDAAADKTLFQGCDNVSIGPVVPVGPDGGIMGSQCKVSIQVTV